MTTGQAVDARLGWLLKRLAEDERVAKAATPGPWHVAWSYRGPSVQSSSDGACIADERDNDHHASYATGDPLLEANSRHVALNDPARVLRTVAALRKIIERHDVWHECDEVLFEGIDCWIGHAIASIYSDAPGYAEHWGEK